MNTGLQDAYNLAWKLALVVQGRADAALLDTYEQERIPVARRLLETTDRAFQAVVSEGWLPQAVAHEGHRPGRRDGDEVRAGPALRLPDDLADRHQLSAERALAGACRTAEGRAGRGRSLPLDADQARPDGPIEDLYGALDDTRFNLLIFGDAPLNRRQFGDMVRTHGIPRIAENDQELARANISQPSFYLLRPDGHVGLCGPGFDAAAIRQYLAERACFKV